MKTTKTIYILGVFLALHFNTVLAGGNPGESPVLSAKVSVNKTRTMLEPATPTVATFEDNTETNFFNPDNSLLAPVMPMEADFSDVAPLTEVSLIKLAPVTPVEADFEDPAGSNN